MRFEREFIQTDRTEEHVIVVTEDERARFIGQFRIVGEHPEESMAVEKQPHGKTRRYWRPIPRVSVSIPLSDA